MPAIAGITLIVRSTTGRVSVRAKVVLATKWFCTHGSLSTCRPEQISCGGKHKRVTTAREHVIYQQEIRRDAHGVPLGVLAMSKVVLGFRSQPSYGPSRCVDGCILFLAGMLSAQSSASGMKQNSGW